MASQDQGSAGPSWLDGSAYGPAEFDRRRCPKGARQAPGDQGGLFAMAREALPAKPAPAVAELPGQGALDLFGDEPA